MNETFRYPIKVLLDEDRNIFIPFITSNAVLVSGTNENVAQQIANRYTKAEVDALIEGLGTLQRIVGRVDTYEELPATGNQNGDTWLVGLASASNHTEYMYINGSWEALGPLIDLENYYNKTETYSAEEITTKLANKVTIVEGKDLSSNDFTDALKEKLEGLSNYDDTAIKSSLSNKLDISKVKNVKDTTAGNVYDTTYINSVIGNIEELLGGI